MRKEGRYTAKLTDRQTERRKALTQLTKQGKSNPTNPTHGQKLWEPTLPHHPTDLIDKINLRTRYPHRDLAPPASSHPFTPSDQQRAAANLGDPRPLHAHWPAAQQDLPWLDDHRGGTICTIFLSALPPMSNKWSSWVSVVGAACPVRRACLVGMALLHRLSHMGHDDAKTPDVG